MDESSRSRVGDGVGAEEEGIGEEGTGKEGTGEEGIGKEGAGETQHISSSAEGLEALVGSFPNGVLVLFDADMRYRIVGPETLPFSERAASSMVGKTVFELFPEPYAIELEPHMEATIAGESRSFDMAYGDFIHHIETVPVTIAEEPFGILVTQEVTAERETTDALADKTRRLETVASVLSHDLRNPLNLALGHLDLIADDVDDSHESYEAIRTSLSRMDTIISDALVLARETELSDVEPVDLAGHVEAAWQLVPTAEATLDVVGTRTVEADRSLFANLLENLVANAVSHGGADVTVRVGPLVDEPGFFLEDDGEGIDESVRETLFEAGVSTGEAEAHSGLGLAIVAEIADAHGWDISATEAASGGARFEIRVPATD